MWTGIVLLFTEMCSTGCVVSHGTPGYGIVRGGITGRGIVWHRITRY